MTSRIGPGKSHRQGIGRMEIADMFPDKATAKAWFEANRCPAARSARIADSPACPLSRTAAMPWRCRGCRKHSSVCSGTVMAESKLPLRKCMFAVYLCASSLKGVSSMELHRDLDITPKTAWFLANRIREAFEAECALFPSPVEVDGTCMGGKRRNMPKAKRACLAGRGARINIPAG